MPSSQNFLKQTANYEVLTKKEPFKSVLCEGECSFGPSPFAANPLKKRAGVNLQTGGTGTG